MLVTEYSVDRRYGGPEEGGWWYDWWTPVRLVSQMLDEPEAIAMATRLNEEAQAIKKARGEKDRYSVIGTPDAVFFVEETYGAEASTEVPHYC